MGLDGMGLELVLYICIYVCIYDGLIDCHCHVFDLGVGWGGVK